MTRPIIVIANAETNETIEREMNDAEFAEYQESINRQNEIIAAREQVAAEAAASKAALLSKLGITEEEAKLLLSQKGMQ